MRCKDWSLQGILTSNAKLGFPEIITVVLPQKPARVTDCEPKNTKFKYYSIWGLQSKGVKMDMIKTYYGCGKLFSLPHNTISRAHLLTLTGRKR